MRQDQSSLRNRVVPARDASGVPMFKEHACEVCDLAQYFPMRDNHHDVAIGLLTILQCFRMAEKQGHVPPLPEGWWVQLTNRHNLQF